MKHKYFLLASILLPLCLLNMVQRVFAETIYLRYYESTYTILGNRPFQFYSFAPLEGELVTVVVYGINPDDQVHPIISVFDPDMQEIQNNLNPEGASVAVMQFVAPMNGVYLLMVTKSGEETGSVRVMLFEGDPIDYDISLLDTGAQLLPDRAFFVAGDSLDPIDLSTYILQEEDEPPKEYYAARGDQHQTAPPDERRTPVEGRIWENNNGEIFYTLNVASNAEVEIIPSPLNAITLADPSFYDFIVQIGAGSEEPVRVDRPICVQTTVPRTIPTHVAPAASAHISGYIPGNSYVEIVAVDPTEEWVQIWDSAQPVGYSWIRRQTTFDLSIPNCNRVEVNGSTQSNWPVIRERYLEAIQAIRANPPGVLISLGFSCGQKDIFGAAYQAIQNQLGGWLPTLDTILNTLQAVSCNNTASAPAEAGDGSVIEVPNLDDPIQPGDSIVIAVPNCTSTVLVGSPAGGVANHFANDFTGNDGCDLIFGNAAANILQGAGGDDTLQGYGGNDTLQGGGGNDAINAGAGDDLAGGGAGNDLIDGDAGNDTYDASDLGLNQAINLSSGFAFAGSDIDILLNVENIRSGPGNDSLQGDGGPNQIEGGAGNDTVRGGGGNDTLLGEDGDDDLIIEGAMGNSSVDSGTGNNHFLVKNGATGNVTLTSGGNDTLDFSDFGAPITFNMGALNTPQPVGGGLILTLTTTIRNLIGTIFGDDVTGSTDGNLILAGDGNDTLDGLDGNDSLYGEGGSDSVAGGDGNDSVYGGWLNDGVNRDDFGNDTVEGGLGDLDQVAGGNHNINGGSGDDGDDLVTDQQGSFDWLIGGNVNEGGSGNDGNDTLIDVEGDEDTLDGGNLNQFGAVGHDGNDSLLDMFGDFDYLYGGNRNEPGATGNDGNDTIEDLAGNGDQIFGGNRNQAGSTGTDGDDRILNQGGNDDRTYGGNFNDGGTGDDGNDSIDDTNAGNRDEIYGGNWNLGGTGNDGNDTITDHAGNLDEIYGGNYNQGTAGNDNQLGGGDVIDANDGAGDLIVSGGNRDVGATGTDGGSDACATDGADATVVNCP